MRRTEFVTWMHSELCYVGTITASWDALQPFPEPVVFFVNFVGQAIAEFLEELSDVRHVPWPIRRLDAQEFVHCFAGDVETIEGRSRLAWARADRSFRRGSVAFDAFEHPLQHAHVFAVAGPQKFSVGAFAEPIHMENFGRMRNAAFPSPASARNSPPCCSRRREAWPWDRAG